MAQWKTKKIEIDIVDSQKTCVYGTDLFNVSVDLDECGKFPNFRGELHIQN